MCGIAGIIGLPSTRIDRGQIEVMTRAMAHRGPDGEGYFVRDHVALGHRRLSIIDIGGGEQPMFNEDNSIVVVYNGEIFNFLEVKADLEAKGHRFRNHCDTEVIVHAYEEYGEQCPTRFRGMFAFAIYDIKKDLVFLGRDRLGIKPLYYHFDGKRLLFASEIKPILRMLDQRPGVDAGLIDFYISLGYVPGERTLFNGIQRLMPGHTLAFVQGRYRTSQYWDIAKIPPLQISDKDAEEKLEHLLLESVKLRLMSEVPLGAFLSGGVDSSAIVACMSKMMNEPVKTFSVGYSDDPASSELEYARIVAKAFKTDHHEFILESGDFFDSLDLLLEHMEEPIVESAAVALYQLSKKAREHVTVILSGEGGDEILAGYPLYKVMPKVDRLHSVGQFIPRGFHRWLGRNFMPSEKAAKYWDWMGTPLSKRYWGISNDVTASVKAGMYQANFAAKVGNATGDYFEALFNKIDAGTDLRRMSYADLKTWLPDDLLIKADKMTMACSLELRVPMLDHHLLEFSTALPDHLRLNGNEGKYLLKKVMERYLPREIIYRPKKGFPVPIAVWFRGPLFERVREILMDSRTLSRGYFRPDYMPRILERHRSGAEDLSRRIFSLLALELWHRKYID
ncbi:MAG: asparagine synthase (glutamine-hydrolyzing) [Betaproteobacteria bacterium]|nr:asparagine synthase (glutamine-hydrolyzing) [Betaproteobacteria bacterium]